MYDIDNLNFIALHYHVAVHTFFWQTLMGNDRESCLKPHANKCNVIAQQLPTLLNENDFKVPRFQSVRYGKHSLQYQSPYLWSKLSRADKYSDNLNLFNKKI